MTAAKRKRGRRPISKTRLAEMIEEATVDAHGESEQTTGWFTMIDEDLGVPFETTVLGVTVTVEREQADRRHVQARSRSPGGPDPRSSAAGSAARARGVGGVDRGVPPVAGRRMTKMGKKPLPQNLQDWVEARKRHHLSHAQVQMARELGMNPKKLGKLDNHDQEPWKAPLPQFIEHLYLKRFGRERPEVVMSVEERTRAQRAKKEARKEAKRRARAEGGEGQPGGTP